MTAGPTARTAVVASAGSSRAAIAELPLSARRTDEVAGAVVVVSGTGWVDAALAAVAAGAAAIVAGDPEAVSSTELRRLEAISDVPVVIDRPLLRPDLAEEAVRLRQGAQPRVICIDGGAGPERRALVVRDALGWLRVIAGAPMLRASAEGLALLETPGGIGATLSIATTSRGSGWIRVHALGEVLTEVEVGGNSGRLTTSSRAGRLVAPARFESSERLALRRALEALEASRLPPDVAEIRADTELAELYLGIRRT